MRVPIVNVIEEGLWIQKSLLEMEIQTISINDKLVVDNNRSIWSIIQVVGLEQTSSEPWTMIFLQLEIILSLVLEFIPWIHLSLWSLCNVPTLHHPIRDPSPCRLAISLEAD
jgi:hypothetical protein